METLNRPSDQEGLKFDFTEKIMASNYSCIVIGAGPAGITMVCSLIESGISSILWVDPEFECGRLSKYPYVPGNIKIKYLQKLIQYFTKLSEIPAQVNNMKIHPFEHLKDYDIKKSCYLREMCLILQKYAYLVNKYHSDKVHFVKGTCQSLSNIDYSSIWKVQIQTNSDQVYQIQTPCVLLNTGSFPVELTYNNLVKDNSPKQSIRSIPMDDALNPQKLKQLVNSNDRVAVIGISHSGVLILKALAELEEQPQKIKAFSLSDVTVAEDKYQQSKYDFTNLKETAAEWAQNNIINGLPPPNMELFLNMQGKQQQIYREQLPECNVVIYSVGFQRNQLPFINYNGELLNDSDIQYNNQNAKLHFIKDCISQKISGLYGFGIGFPQEVQDISGEYKSAVGITAFAQYQKKVIREQLKGYIMSFQSS